MLLLSSLDYDNASYIAPPFPPAQDDLKTPQREFVAGLAAVRSYVTRGFTYRVKTALVGATTAPETQFTVKDALAELSATSVCEEQTFLSQTKFDGAGVDLVLFYNFPAPVKPKGAVNFSFEFESIGLAFPLGVNTAAACCRWCCCAAPSPSVTSLRLNASSISPRNT